MDINIWLESILCSMSRNTKPATPAPNTGPRYW